MDIQFLFDKNIFLKKFKIFRTIAQISVAQIQNYFLISILLRGTPRRIKRQLVLKSQRISNNLTFSLNKLFFHHFWQKILICCIVNLRAYKEFLVLWLRVELCDPILNVNSKYICPIYGLRTL